jgi:hypothetical protein
MRETSLDAYASVRPSLPAKEARFLQLIRWSEDYGYTLSELAFTTGVLLQSACGTRLALEKKGLIKDSGKRRKTPTGRNAIVWVAA